jgi:hypothetical protein
VNIKTRAAEALGLKFFGGVNLPEEVGPLSLSPPRGDQHVLRMLVRRPNEGLRLPPELQWIVPMIGMAESYQDGIARHPFLYVTVRSGSILSQGDDKWHTDGFSMRYHHLPEQNYTWVDTLPTEYYAASIPLPADFDPRVHNIHSFFQSRVDCRFVRSAKAGQLYALDPYVIHRRPPARCVESRCFVRLSYTPIEIADRNNTPNPSMPTNYTRDGVLEFRDRLLDYKGRP